MRQISPKRQPKGKKPAVDDTPLQAINYDY